ncbi:MAG: response regulator [Thermohalobaculum sp.]|nr:response regulator [Thermohalobaculum sp.]
MTRRVLLAEDEPHIVESLQFLLGRAGFAVTVVSDGEAAFSRALADLPDVLVLDVMLPGINGFEVLRRLRAEAGTAHLPVVMLTAKGQREDRETAHRWGADLFIAKPFSNAELVAAVSRLAGSGPQ